MRISGWSSDLCSSDLELPDVVPPVTRRRQISGEDLEIKFAFDLPQLEDGEAPDKLVVKSGTARCESVQVANVAYLSPPVVCADLFRDQLRQSKDRTSVVKGKSVSVRVAMCGCR